MKNIIVSMQKKSATTKYSTHEDPTWERSKYVVRDGKSSREIYEMLDRYGVCVVPKMLTKDECHSHFTSIAKEMENVIPGFHYDQVDSWDKVRNAKFTHSMIAQTLGYGWFQSIVDLRTKLCFVRLFTWLFSYVDYGRFGSDKKWSVWDMFSSADGFSMYLIPDFVKGKKDGELRPNAAGYFRRGHDWLHWDQEPSNSLYTVQSFVHLASNSKEEGRVNAGFAFLEGSHKHQPEFQARFLAKYEGVDESKANPRFYLLGSQEEFDFYAKEKGCAYKGIRAKAGDLVLWLSPLIHQGRLGEKPSESTRKQGGGMKRSVVYISMQPNKYARTVDKVNKKRAFENLRTTTHDPSYGVQLFNKKPRLYSAEEIKDLKEGRLAKPLEKKPVLTDFQKSLFGL